MQYCLSGATVVTDAVLSEASPFHKLGTESGRSQFEGVHEVVAVRGFPMMERSGYRLISPVSSESAVSPVRMKMWIGANDWFAGLSRFRPAEFSVGVREEIPHFKAFEFGAPTCLIFASMDDTWTVPTWLGFVSSASDIAGEITAARSQIKELLVDFVSDRRNRRLQSMINDVRAVFAQQGDVEEDDTETWAQRLAEDITGAND